MLRSIPLHLNMNLGYKLAEHFHTLRLTRTRPRQSVNIVETFNATALNIETFNAYSIS